MSGLPTPFFFGGDRRKYLARVTIHQKDNPGHRIINWECDSCDYIEVVGWTEEDYEKMSRAETNCHDFVDRLEAELWDLRG